MTFCNGRVFSAPFAADRALKRYRATVLNLGSRGPAADGDGAFVFTGTQYRRLECVLTAHSKPCPGGKGMAIHELKFK